MKYRGLLMAALIMSAGLSIQAAKPYKLVSPDKSVIITVSVGDSICYNVVVDGKLIVGPSVVSFKTDAEKQGLWKVSKAKTGQCDEVLHPIVWQKNKAIRDTYQQLYLEFTNGLSLTWRAYNNGIAWHWGSRLKGEYKVTDEQATFRFDKDGKAWYPLEKGFISHNERLYYQYPFDSIGSDRLASLPVLFSSNNIKVLLTEANLFNYAGMWIHGSNNGQIVAVFPHYPRSIEPVSDRDVEINGRENFIAKINGQQEFPWRILMIARNDNDLLTNQLVYQLSKPSEGDFSWVKPGKVQWDWWNANNIYGVDFKAGINTQTYEYYIDFAAKYGIEYVILDEGWSDTRNLLKVSPDIDMNALTAYAQKKGVGLILWMTWMSLDNNMEPVMDQLVKWGIKGIKVDFMQRDDQVMVNFYERVAKEAAKHKLLVDFHGAYKPTGLYRTYPNVLTSEGVYGLEQSKFSDKNINIAPPHNVTLPFIRQAAGPMDYTPGAMLNAQRNAWKAIYSEPMSLGTRCHQLAMYVVFESSLQMLSDNPTHYSKEPECMEFLKAVPVEWDTTIPLQSKVGNYVSLARKAKNGDWYIGAMTDWSPRTLTVALSFLGQGKYKMFVWKDGVNADRNAKDFKTESTVVDRSSVITIDMANGGGWVARLVKQD